MDNDRRRKSTHLSLEKVVREVLREQRFSLKIQPPHSSSWIHLLENEKIVIGRSADCDITLDDDNVSREHLAVYQQNDEFYVEDLVSTNGTYLNSVRIVKCLLRPNDSIHLGAHVIVFDYKEA